MNQTLIKSVEQNSLKAVQDFKPGYTVKVYQKIKEGEKERIQVFEGLIISVSGEKGTNHTITVRKIVGGIGVEKIFPVHSSTIEKIEITKIAKVRRAKLYYMRDRSGKSARLKETHIKADDKVNVLPKLAKDVSTDITEDDVTTQNNTKEEAAPEEKATINPEPNNEENSTEEQKD